jgi:iron complex transport system substrate-binding protein
MPASALLLASAAVRAASLNLCADEYLLLLAKPSEVASVSYLARDPLESPLWKVARTHPANRGSIEAVLGTRPTVVLTMGGGGRASGLIAKRLGLRTIDLKANATPADVETNLRIVASALRRPDAARKWIERLRRLQITAPATATDAIWLSSGGQSFGPGSAGSEWMRLAGFRQRALPGGRASLETLLVHPPKVIVESDYRRGQLSGGARWLQHPIVRNARSTRIRTDGRAWTCMGPLMIGEIERLRRIGR